MRALFFMPFAVLISETLSEARGRENTWSKLPMLREFYLKKVYALPLMVIFNLKMFFEVKRLKHFYIRITKNIASNSLSLQR